MGMKVFNQKLLLLIGCIFILFIGSSFSNTNYEVKAKESEKSSIVNSINTYETKLQNKRLYSLAKNHIERDMLGGKQTQIERVKELKDFNDNIYTLFELKPTGYIIYHNESGKFIEYSLESPSPYLGHHEELYYG